MKTTFNRAVRQYLKWRYKRVEQMRQSAPELQHQLYHKLLARTYGTSYGIKHSIHYSMTMDEYRNSVPIVGYEELSPYIMRMMDGERDVLCKGKVVRFAKSSGTTGDRSKYLPMPWHYHKNNHVAASWDTMSIVYKEDPQAKIFEKKSIIMGGSIQHMGKALVGDVSAILLDKMHWAGRPFFTPDFETAKLGNWEVKIEKMANICKDEPVVMFGGVPTWSLVLCHRILEITGKSNMHEVWPEVSYYMHGGVSFLPYIDQFKELFPDPKFKYYEVYNASEGYFAVNDYSTAESMLLLVNNDIYYEFLPLDELDKPWPMTITLQQVEIGKVYAMVITTSAGITRYLIGDTVTFTSKAPYKLLVVGRTKQCINVFGEEVMVANTDKALKMTTDILPAKVSEYTVAPLFLSKGTKGGHQWLIEFDQTPDDLEAFSLQLDINLRKINSDYDAKRSRDIALQRLQIQAVSKGTFHNWLRKKGKIGGQNKVPRLSNTRKYLDEIISTENHGNN